MELKILDTSGVVCVADEIFTKKFNEDLIHQVVQAYRAGGRSGNRAQKSRSEVRGGGAKPRPQKGSGRSRAGTIRSPIWRGGGVTFAAKQKDFSQKINKKMYSGAMCSILSELVRQDRLVLVDNFVIASQKTRDFTKKLAEFGLKQVLIVVDEIDPNLYLASRNLINVDVCDVNGVNPVNLIGFEKVLFTVPALKKVEERLA
ncbi:MAG: 50S ribosomal protein L4 [bacterium]